MRNQILHSERKGDSWVIASGNLFLLNGNKTNINQHLSCLVKEYIDFLDVFIFEASKNDNFLVQSISSFRSKNDDFYLGIRGWTYWYVKS
jgi:hypothetical protein